MGTETKNKSHLLECVHIKEMVLRSLRKLFWVLEDLYFKGAEKKIYNCKLSKGTTPRQGLGAYLLSTRF